LVTLQETNHTKMDGLELSFKTKTNNGYKLRSNVNLTSHSKTSMDTSKDKAEIITKVTSDKTIKTTSDKTTKTTNRCHKVPGYNLLETTPIQMVY
jgi:hypothetical protein